MHRLSKSQLACLALVGVWVCAPAMAASPPEQNVSAVKPMADSAVVAPVAEETTETATTSESAATRTVNFHGVVVAIDPETGRLREPTAIEREQLSAMMLQHGAAQSRTTGVTRPLNEEQARATIQRSQTGLVGMSVQLPLSKISYLSAERQPDGSINIHHQGETTAETAKAVLQ